MRDAVFVGIDVSKGTLDVALRPSGESFRVSNDQGGISALVERLSAVQPELVVLEASGGYETAVVAELAATSIFALPSCRKLKMATDWNGLWSCFQPFHRHRSRRRDHAEETRRSRPSDGYCQALLRNVG
jgi:hypothetical protein